MERRNVILKTGLGAPEVIERLEKLNGKGKFVDAMSLNKLYFGTITKEKIILRIYDAPSAEIDGVIEEKDSNTELHLSLKGDKNLNMNRSLIIGLVYPILIVCIILFIIFNHKSILVYITSALALLAPIVLLKIIDLLRLDDTGTDLDIIIRRIEKQLEK